MNVIMIFIIYNRFATNSKIEFQNINQTFLNFKKKLQSFSDFHKNFVIQTILMLIVFFFQYKN